MFATRKFFRLASLAFLAALPIGSGLLQPAGANAGEIIRLSPIIRRPVVVAAPVVAVAPAVTVAPVAPVVRVAPAVTVAPVVTTTVVRPWYGYRWYR
jgi:hypothetical protein